MYWIKKHTLSICKLAFSKIGRLFEVCSVCKHKNVFENSNLCKNCIDEMILMKKKLSIPKIDRVIIGYMYRYPLKNLIIELKFSKNKHISSSLGYLLSKYLSEYFASNPCIKTPKAILSVPLHNSRLKKRGFNQSQLLAQEVSKKLGIPIINCVYRKKDTLPQINLAKKDRKENIKNAFEITKDMDILSNLPDSIAIIDDVITTGSTIKEVASVLRKKTKIKTIYAFALSAGN
jgi:competence protein ComFC